MKIRKNAPRLVLRTACETLPVATRQRVLRAETKPLTTEDTEVYRGNQILGFPLYTSVSSVIKISLSVSVETRPQRPYSSKNFSTSKAAMQPEPAAVMAWR